jgi:hypothetical protein
MSGLNKDEISRIIYDNGLFHGTMALGVVMDADHLERFANLVAAAEREACAKVCDELVTHTQARGDGDATLAAFSCAAAIRARGQG